MKYYGVFLFRPSVDGSSRSSIDYDLDSFASVVRSALFQASL